MLQRILGGNRNDSSPLARYKLHWLAVEDRIKFKILTLVSKYLNYQTSLYIQQLLN